MLLSQHSECLVHVRCAPSRRVDRPVRSVRQEAALRRALNYAVDRNAVIAVARAGAVAQPTCQVLPPNFPGYRPYCPYTANRSAGNHWVAPDLDRARRLVAASGTKGELVTVWTADRPEGAYIAAVLRRLGYRTRLKTVTRTTQQSSIRETRCRSARSAGSPTSRPRRASSPTRSSIAPTSATMGSTGRSRGRARCRRPTLGRRDVGQVAVECCGRRLRRARFRELFRNRQSRAATA